MKQINFKEMYNAGVHLGSSIKTINPKMKPYIMCTHDGIAIIDILKTYTRLFRVTLFLKKVIATEGYQVLFVGTQKSIAPLIADIATKSSSPYINKGWSASCEGEKEEKFRKQSRTTPLTKTEEITKLTHVTKLTSLPDIVIIVGQQKELKAVKECEKLNIPTITILDSDGDPEKTSLFIPANDDSWTSVEFILKHLGHSILVGRLLYDKVRTHQF
uniref:ribosomal protein S2 n=1 Tax=Cephaleuros karstenii TaxID=1985640 RepID=UPI001EDCC6C2|nr:ribosomal protein S2 [Cephaleuros karstenii]UIB39134.1 ribosomal protein S2 [Cephaleuros karstenii]